MRSPSAVTAVALTVMLVGGCARPEGLRVEGPALSPSPIEGPVYMADETGEPLQRPTRFEVGESTVLVDLRWRSWGDATAEASGGVSGSWCSPGCADRPFQARIKLSGLKKHAKVAYYSRATVVAAGLPPERAAELGRVRLHVPVF